MIGGLRVIALVPARGGSKSVPRKNLQLLGGRPLLSWPIDSARAAPEVDRIVVSTDDDEIAAAAREFGAEVYRRPAALATDTALVIDAIRQFRSVVRAEGERAELMVLLEATSPLREPGLISRCVRRLVDDGFDSVATFHEAETNPERTWRIESGVPRPFIDGAIPWKPRQQLTPAFELNGAVYAFRLDRLPDEGPSVLFGRIGAEIVSAESVIDIDTRKDFLIANALLQS